MYVFVSLNDNDIFLVSKGDFYIFYVFVKFCSFCLVLDFYTHLVYLSFTLFHAIFISHNCFS